MVSRKSKKAIIISKFNRRYKHCMEDILNYYADVATQENDIVKIQLKDIDFEQMTFSFRHEMVEFEILKPVRYENDKVCKNWGEVESTIVDMCRKAAASKHLSSICLKKIVYPDGPLDLLLVLGVCLLFLARYQPDFVYDTLLAKIPYVEKLRPWNTEMLIATAIIHIIEMWVCLRPKLAYYRVPIDYQLEWYCCAMLDGYMSANRLERYVKHIKGRYFNFEDETLSIEAPVVDSDSEL